MNTSNGEGITQLTLGDLETDEKSFQWRMGYNIEESSRHVGGLKDVLKDKRKPLDPILVYPRGAGFVVIDGHHRLEAYKEASWDGPVPVEVFQGTPQEAELEALRRNIKDKLPMTREDKLESAWRLVKERSFSKSKISELTTVSNGTIGNMRAALEKHGDEAMANMLWSRVKLMNYDLDDDYDFDAHKQQKAEKLAKELTDKTSVRLAHNPDILALALEMISPRLPRSLVEQWIPIAMDIVDLERSQEKPPI
jgi:ParB-like chromosome segregation protein Spo0J